MTSICWNEAKTVGIICEDDQLAYELRKGAMNPLGIVTPAFMDAWGDMTADDNCTKEKVIQVGWAYNDKRWAEDRWHVCGMDSKPHEGDYRKIEPVFLTIQDKYAMFHYQTGV